MGVDRRADVSTAFQAAKGYKLKKVISAPGGHQAETETLRTGLGVADVEDALQRLFESGDLLLLSGKGAHSPEVGDDLPSVLLESSAHGGAVTHESIVEWGRGRD